MKPCLGKTRVKSTMLLSWQRKNTTPFERLSAATSKNPHPITLSMHRFESRLQHAIFRTHENIYGADVGFLHVRF